MQEKAARYRGFTLIELLIVVAIIAILAAIAIPNFLEAQTRAKVSRAKSDMRTISVGIESYFVDYGNWPYPTHLQGLPPQPLQPMALQYVTELTTPVAYLSTVLTKDPFKPASPEQSDVWDVRPDFCGGYSYVNWNGWWGQNVDTFSTPGTYSKFPCYVLSSMGPDAIWDHVWWLPGLQRFGPPSAVSATAGLNLVYDATNGTNSRGDIPRFGGEAGLALGN